MDSHSRSNRRLPKGLPFPDDSKITKNKKLLCSNTMLIAGKLPGHRTVPRRHGSFVIGSAYNEPTGDNLIEHIILQRDFIID